MIPRFLAAGLVLGLALPAQAQDLAYTMTTRMEFSGPLGSVMSLVGGADETVEQTWVKGRMVRTDSDDESTILDLESGRIISIDHDAKTYMVMTLDELMGMIDRSVAEGRAAVDSQTAGMERPEGHADLEYELSVDPTGERQRIDGYNAERYLLTMRTKVSVQPGEGEAQQTGNLVVLQDTWNSGDVPIGEAMAAFHEIAPELAERRSGAVDGMAAMFASRPGMQEAMEEAKKEAGKMDGVPLRTTTYMVLLPDSAEFDRDAVLSEAESGEKESGGGLSGLLRGLAGGGDRQGGEAQEVGQMTLAKVITETRDIRTDPVPADMFEIPAGYTERPFPGR